MLCIGIVHNLQLMLVEHSYQHCCVKCCDVVVCEVGCCHGVFMLCVVVCCHDVCSVVL